MAVSEPFGGAAEAFGEVNRGVEAEKISGLGDVGEGVGDIARPGRAVFYDGVDSEDAAKLADEAVQVVAGAAPDVEDLSADSGSGHRPNDD